MAHLRRAQVTEHSLQTQPLGAVQGCHNTLQLRTRRRSLPGHSAVDLQMNCRSSAGTVSSSLQCLHVRRRPHDGGEPVLHDAVGILRLHAAHHQHMSIALPESLPHPRSLVNVTHSQPRDPGLDQHRRDKFRTMAVTVGLDDREHVGVLTGSSAYRGDVVPQPRL